MRLTDYASGGGCGCKLPPLLLRELLQRAQVFGAPPPAALLVGAAGADDAAVWKLNDTQALVASVDFFSPLVDTARDFGRIAAANALSDIYAMGARPLLALALLALPAALTDTEEGTAVAAEILAGGREVCAEAGAVLAGGHSIRTQEVLFGLAVLGLVHPQQVLTNAGGQAGDVLLLGKPLGVGVLAAALRRGTLAAADAQALVAQAAQLNRAGAELPQVAGVHAVTDVTGFGLLGHLAEVCRASGCGARVQMAALPVLDAAQQAAQAGVASGACARNWQSAADLLSADAADSVAEWQRTILTDPQTSGGLLVACAPSAVEEVQAVFAAHAQQAVCVGELTAQAGIVLES